MAGKSPQNFDTNSAGYVIEFKNQSLFIFQTHKVVYHSYGRPLLWANELDEGLPILLTSQQ